MSTPMVSLEHITHEDTPFRWYHARNTFGQADLDALLKTFPHDGLRMVTRSGLDKSYAMYHRQLHPLDGTGESAAELAEPWRRFVTEVTGPAYRAAVARLTGLPIDDGPVEVNVWRYGRSCWLAPHVDKPEKLVTHILYFNEAWPSEQGGDLLLLGSSSEADVVRRIPPVANTGVLLPRGEDSWHAVERVHDAATGLERLSAQVIFQRG
ncbi:2OG-Fe(II) oxygenase [Actinomadura graeca]|uniref:2OG-Fe(II) oxygenase n=1 Tax=Actinomadura graeca TaxID=2750812 RepID=A0ABX8R5A3_9ACTN|nr:2OG-Fe(II) oxygenase [Actinomadura graeca]QXJ25706.1 2OG-Fe(II) oxygenase [Actinomadura graeca]